MSNGTWLRGGVSDLCEVHQIQSTLFCQWQEQLFENGAAPFLRRDKPKASMVEQRRIAKLRLKHATKNEVLWELGFRNGGQGAMRFSQRASLPLPTASLVGNRFQKGRWYGASCLRTTTKGPRGHGKRGNASPSFSVRGVV